MLWLSWTLPTYQLFPTAVIQTKKNQPGANDLNVAPGDKILDLRFCVVLTAKFPSRCFDLNFCKLSLWSTCCLIHVSNVFSIYMYIYFLLLIYSLLFFLLKGAVIKQSCHLSRIVQCTVRWVSGRIKSEQTPAWNKCWCTVPNAAQSVLFIFIFNIKCCWRILKTHLHWELKQHCSTPPQIFLFLSFFEKCRKNVKIFFFIPKVLQ